MIVLMWQMVLVVFNLANLWFTGHVPRIVRVASMYSLSPTAVLRKVAARRLDQFRLWVNSALGLDRLRISPREIEAIWEWRIREGRPMTAAAPPEVALAVHGTLLEMDIEGVMPTSTCFLQVRSNRPAPSHSSYCACVLDGT